MGRAPRIDDLYALRVPSEPALSPTGDTVVYSLLTADREQDENHSALWSVRHDGEPPKALTHGPADSSPAWSPDGQAIAFLRAGERTQLWLLPAAGGEARPLTDLPLGAGAPTWSPDGERIAFAAPVDVGVPEPSERAEHDPIVVDALGYKADGSGLARGLRSHVHVIDHVHDPARRAVRQLTDGDWNASAPAWHPDGTRLAFAAEAGPDPDLTMASAAYVIDVDGPAGFAEPVRVGSATGIADLVTWSADGTDLLVAGRQSVASGHTSVLRVPADGSGETVDLTRDLDRNVMPGKPGYPSGRPQLTRAGDALAFCLRERGCTQAYVADLRTGANRPLYAEQGHVVSGLSVARDADRAAVVVARQDSYGEVVTVDLTAAGASAVRSLTGHTAEALPDVDLLPAESREFTISDGTVVHGWLLRRPGAAPGPLLLDVHGGPHNAWSPVPDRGRLYHQLLAARGWSVLLLNPRGSDGYGESFYTGVTGGWGVNDERDFTEPLDALVAEGIADPAQLAVSGYSYGGFTTCHLTGRTDRFAAAVAGGVVSDLTSMAGTSDLGHMLATLENAALPHQDPERVRRQSPIERVANVRTPTLVVHGLDDDRCPVGQGEEWFSALRAQGVPTRMVLYPGASHLFLLEGRPSHRTDYSRRLMGWLDRYVPGRAVAPLDQQHWHQRLGVLARRHGAPGASLGILRRGVHWADGADELAEAAYGVMSTETGDPASVDSRFQIGSITKVWTTTLAMQLVDEGKVGLDQPVVDILPDLDLGDPDVTARVTLRHLLTHTSGVNGDVFTDTGRGDDYLRDYVAGLADVGINHPLGATFSYCNAGFGIAGRMIEVLTGCSWDEVLRKRLIEPLGLTRTSTLPEEALLGRAAIGHVGEPGEPPHVAPAWGLPRSAGPAGLISSTPRELLAFARMHLSGGTAQDGSKLLSTESITAMRSHQTDLPDPYALGDSWGIGWIRYRWGDCDLVGHDGNTIGQSAFLRVLPEQGLAVTLLTNGGNTKDLYQDLFGEIMSDLAGVEIPAPIAPQADAPSFEPDAYVGRYERTGARIEVSAKDGALSARITSTGPLAELADEPTHEYALAPVSADTFALRSPGARTWSSMVFYRL
ncbi:MAG: serine hydrolase, partial [Streptosporangiales bacterium]